MAQYLRKNIEESYLLDEVAKEFGLSSRTLSRLFKEDLGMSYIKFSRAIRIFRALELMASTNLSIFEISLLVGYSSLSSFSNIFYRVIGIRPQEYMKSITKSGRVIE
ncbi:helix-turn-helix transcriptional regulator [Elizabethkingia sp. JS20170427COW]|nr:helix-turn-helix transcriptional regulator [Elizabethkingia sp. JS20170427COW]